MLKAGPTGCPLGVVAATITPPVMGAAIRRLRGAKRRIVGLTLDHLPVWLLLQPYGVAMRESGWSSLRSLRDLRITGNRSPEPEPPVPFKQCLDKMRYRRRHSGRPGMPKPSGESGYAVVRVAPSSPARKGSRPNVLRPGEKPNIGEDQAQRSPRVVCERKPVEHLDGLEPPEMGTAA